MKQHEKIPRSTPMVKIEKLDQTKCKRMQLWVKWKPFIGKREEIWEARTTKHTNEMLKPTRRGLKKWTKNRSVEKPNNDKTLKKCDMFNSKITRAKLSD
jgi:hypothetical protein